MKPLFLMLLSVALQFFTHAAHAAQELKLFAPAVLLHDVLWWGPSNSGLKTWTAGQPLGVYPARLGEIKTGRLNNSQEIIWRGGRYLIDSIERTDTGALDIRFEKAKLIMSRTIDGYFSVDIWDIDAKQAHARFRTTMKSTDHDAFRDPDTRGSSDLKMFAPAIEFTQVTWWGFNANGLSSWFAGADGTPTPANLGLIHKGRITGSQQIVWFNRNYDILSVNKTATGAISVVFGGGKLEMIRSADGYYFVDVFPGESTIAVERFKTSRKATAHDAVTP